MPCYNNSESMMTATCYKSDNNNDKSDNNKDKVYLLLRRSILVDYLLNHMLDYMLDYMVDHIIINFVTMALQLLSFLIWVPINK